MKNCLRVLILRAEHQAFEFANRLKQVGFTPVIYPVIKIIPFHEVVDPLRIKISEGWYDWILFTSVNGVNIFFKRLSHLKASVSSKTKLGAIGPATANAIRSYGYEVHCVPKHYYAESLAESLGEVRNLKILLPRSKKARPTLRELLLRKGALVEEIFIYDTKVQPPEEEIPEADIVVFTSPSTVEGFKIALKDKPFPKNLKSLCIGPITKRKAEEVGFPVHAIAPEFTLDGIIEILKIFYS